MSFLSADKIFTENKEHQRFLFQPKYRSCQHSNLFLLHTVYVWDQSIPKVFYFMLTATSPNSTSVKAHAMVHPDMGYFDPKKENHVGQKSG